MDETEDPRRAALEARRWHVVISMNYGTDFGERCGEFFYDSERAARAAVRREYGKWEGIAMIHVDMPPSDWRRAWAGGGMRLLVDFGEGREGWFCFTIADKENPREPEPVEFTASFSGGGDDE